MNSKTSPSRPCSKQSSARPRSKPSSARPTTSGRPCSALTASGRPCQAWAIHNTDPPLCSAHSGRNKGAGAPPGNQNRLEHGFYSRTFTLQELADLLRLTLFIYQIGSFGTSSSNQNFLSY